MTDQSTLGARIKLAMAAFAVRQPGKRTSHAAYGAAVASVEGVQPYAADTVYDWLCNAAVPSYATMGAIAELAGRATDAQLGQLLYGDEQAIHGLNEADYRRFHRVG
ncbi:MAG: hypothetical protein JWM41_2920 [Gemmatimonadetes bacterium]|nr:hypothetical protein [Gemmatimonadota bacterium]